jgi:hypothetical protein
MKKFVLILAAVVVMGCVGVSFAACGGNVLKIPNGTYMACEENGDYPAEGNYNSVSFTIKGGKVVMNGYNPGYKDFNTTGKIKSNADYGGHFVFTYKRHIELWGGNSTVYYRVTDVSYNPQTKILTTQKIENYNGLKSYYIIR